MLSLTACILGNHTIFCPFSTPSLSTFSCLALIRSSSGNAFALFTKSQRKWESPPLQEDHKAQFRALAAEHKYDATRYVIS